MLLTAPPRGHLTEVKKDNFRLYANYLIETSGYATVTGLSAMLEGDISHDQVTQFLSQQPYTQKSCGGRSSIPSGRSRVWMRWGVLSIADTLALGRLWMFAEIFSEHCRRNIADTGVTPLAVIKDFDGQAFLLKDKKMDVNDFVSEMTLPALRAIGSPGKRIV